MSELRNLARSYRASYLNKNRHEQAASKDRETVAERSCWLPRGKLARAAWLPPLHLDPPGRCCPVKDVLRSLLIPSNLYRSTITPVVCTLRDTPFIGRAPRVSFVTRIILPTLSRASESSRVFREGDLTGCRTTSRRAGSHRIRGRRSSFRDSFDPRLEREEKTEKGEEGETEIGKERGTKEERYARQDTVRKRSLVDRKRRNVRDDDGDDDDIPCAESV